MKRYKDRKKLILEKKAPKHLIPLLLTIDFRREEIGVIIVEEVNE